MEQISTTSLIGAALIFFVMLVLFSGGGAKRRPGWFSRPQNRPAVYLIRSRRWPDRFKVGYTSRRVETRMTEIARKNGPVEILFFLRMPHAYLVEQTVHARMRQMRGIRALGGEWYRGDPEKGRRAILSAARSLKKSARFRLAWPRGAEIKIYKDF